MVMSHGNMEGDWRENRDYLRLRTAEKYMNTDTIDVEDRAAGTRMLHQYRCDCVTAE